MVLFAGRRCARAAGGELGVGTRRDLGISQPGPAGAVDKRRFVGPAMVTGCFRVRLLRRRRVLVPVGLSHCSLRPRFCSGT